MALVLIYGLCTFLGVRPAGAVADQKCVILRDGSEKCVQPNGSYDITPKFMLPKGRARAETESVKNVVTFGCNIVPATCGVSTDAGGPELPTCRVDSCRDRGIEILKAAHCILKNPDGDKCELKSYPRTSGMIDRQFARCEVKTTNCVDFSFGECPDRKFKARGLSGVKEHMYFPFRPNPPVDNDPSPKYCIEEVVNPTVSYEPEGPQAGVVE